MTVFAWREKRVLASDGVAGVLMVVMGVIAAGATLSFSMSKGAIIAAVCGVLLMVVAPVFKWVYGGWLGVRG